MIWGDGSMSSYYKNLAQRQKIKIKTGLEEEKKSLFEEADPFNY